MYEELIGFREVWFAFSVFGRGFLGFWLVVVFLFVWGFSYRIVL